MVIDKECGCKIVVKTANGLSSVSYSHDLVTCDKHKKDPLYEFRGVIEAFENAKKVKDD